MSRELLQRILALMPLASKDETRWHLNGVVLSEGVKAGEILIEVCDGHRMVSERVWDVDLILGEGNKVIIRKSQIPIIKNALKDIYIELGINTEFKFIRVNATYGINYETVTSFPDLDSVRPKKEGQYKFGVNAKYLFEISKALKEDSKHSDHVEIVLDFNKDGKVLEPMLINKNGKQAVLMSVRV